MPPSTSPAPDPPSQRIAALERSNRNLSMLLRSAPIPVLILDHDLRLEGFSAALLDVARLDNPARGIPLDGMAWAIDMDWLPAAARRVLDGGAAEERTVEAPALDTQYCVRVLPWEARNGAGVAVALQPRASAGGIVDQQRCREALAGVQRLKHQLSNSMLLTRSVIRRSAETAQGLDDYVLHLETRLDSIHRVLAATVREPVRTFVLRDLIEDELEAQGAYQTSGTRLVSGPEVTLRPAAAQVLAVVIQELVTNAFQHGVLSREDGGQLHVEWTIGEGGTGRQLQLDWTERGPAAPPSRKGFGTTVLEDVLAYQLDGKVTRSFDQRSMRVTLTIPMESLSGEDGDFFDLL